MTAEKVKRLKSIFRGYRRMTPKLRAELKRMGFTMETGGKHLILHYGKRKTVISITASDRRTGQNSAAQLARMMKESRRPDSYSGMEY